MKKQLSFTLGILSSSILVYVSSLCIALLSAITLMQGTSHLMPSETTVFSLSDFLLSIIIVIVLLYLLIRFVKTKMVFQGLFFFVLFTGMYVQLSIAFSQMTAFLITISLLVIYACIQTIFLHNLLLILAVSGIGWTLGFSFPLNTALFLLALFVMYDIVAVFVTRHMQKMFVALKNQGMILAFVLPSTINQWNLSLDKAWKKKVGILGTGDIAFAIFLSVSALKVGIQTSIFIAIGGLIGLLALQVYVYTRKTRQAWPALPAIGLGIFLGYLISWIV